MNTTFLKGMKNAFDLRPDINRAPVHERLVHITRQDGLLVAWSKVGGYLNAAIEREVKNESARIETKT